MKNIRFVAALLLMAAPIAILNGCGGGGGGSSSPSPTATPTPSPTATVGPRVLVVQLRDRNGNAVNGIVTVGTTVLATSGGTATFNRDIAAGATTVTAEVDGTIMSGIIDVRTAGTTVFSLLIEPQITPAPTATLPPPPF